MIELGNHDFDIQTDRISAYLAKVKQLVGDDFGNSLRGETGERVSLRPIEAAEEMSVSEVQQFLRDAGFYPGGTVDGICGYRTLAAIRLFQEYVRSVEGLPSMPDGLFGDDARGHVRRWLNAPGRKADWSSTFDAWSTGTLGSNEYSDWITFLNAVKGKYAANPTPMLRLLETYREPTDTKGIAEWDFDPKHVHLIGIRRAQSENQHRFDDVMILLIKGLVFKFQASTDPGFSRHLEGKGAPFLVQGQHDYTFGWHRSTYHALRPLHHALHPNHGVLVVRSKGDYRLTDEDLGNGLEANGTINIHWGGRGLTRNVNNWSEGCQIIAGSAYINHQNKLVDCSGHVAINNGAITNKQTRGAYNVLADLVTALSSDIQGNVVKYMLLMEEDLALSPAITSAVQQARSAAATMMR